MADSRLGAAGYSSGASSLGGRMMAMLCGKPRSARPSGASTCSISSGLSQPLRVLLCSPSQDKADQQEGNDNEEEVGDHFVGTRALLAARRDAGSR